MENVTLTFVNVGYGEAILAECPDDRLPGGRFTMLIDGGSAEAGEYAGSQTGRIPAADYLRRRHIRALNLLVSTHIHEDHVCGLLDAVSVAPPAEMWQALPENLWREMRHIDPAVAEDPSMDKFLRSLNDYQALCRTLDGQGCAIRCISAGAETDLCMGLTARVLGPDTAHIDDLADRIRQLYQAPDLATQKRLITATDSCMNNYSVILLLNYRGTRVLLPGDTNCVGYAGLERELRADLFKLGHHGQKDSVTPELLEFISPRHAVCCASSDRRYNSAHPAPLGLLRTHGVHCWFSDCPEGEAVPPHSELTFTIGPDGAVEGVYR